MRKVGTVVRAGTARRWTRPLFLGIASLSVALVVVAGCTPVKPTPPPTDTPDTAAPGAPSTPDLAAASDTGVSNTDNITNDTAPTFTGTAEAGSTVKLLEGSTEIGSGTATGGAYSVTTSALAEGDHTITATATDPANNTSPASLGLVVAIDVTAPAGPSTPVLDAPSDSGTSADGITNDNTPTFTGTAVTDATVTIHDGGTAVGSAPAIGGNYSVVTSALSDGDRAITATASDVAGNPSAASTALMITIDTGAPVVSVATPTNGAVTNDNTPALSGAAENAQVTVSIYTGPAPSGTPVQTLTPSATSGAWSQDAGALADGVYTAQATQGDTAGNVGTSSANTFTVDTVAPLAPSTPDLDAASDTGTSDTDDVTSDTTPTFIGTVEADTLVRILADGIEVGSGTATGGNYNITTSTLTDDLYTITATTTDAATNPSAASGGLQVTIDSTVPAAPSTPDLDAGSDTGTSSADEDTSDPTPTFTGTAETGSTVRIFDGLTEVGSGTATGGNYSITTSVLADGVHSITATATDVAGTSPASGALSVTIDTTDPTVAVVAPAHGAVTSDDTPEVSGTASLDSTVTVEIYDGSDTSGTLVDSLTPTAAGGLWSGTATTLADGEYTVVATQTDAAGNTGTSAAIRFTVDTTAPAAPSTPNLDAGSDTGTSESDNITNDNTPTFTGTAEEGSLVRIFDDGIEVGSGTANGGANYSITTSVLADGVHDITATATDAALNTSGPSGELEVTIDNNVPAAPSTPDLVAGSDTGAFDTDDVTSDDTPTFSGTAEPGSIVRILDGPTEVGSATATGGAYSITTSALSDDVHSITATATDVAGTSPPSGALSVTIDTAQPSVTVTAPADGSSTSDNTPPLAGAAEDGGVAVTIYEGSDTTGTVNQTFTPTAAGGLWSDTATTLADGAYTVQATQTDAAGNIGTSSANTFTVDTTAPTAPSTPDLDTGSDTGTSSTDDVTSEDTPTFTGTAEEDSLVRILADGVEVGLGTATGGTYSITTSALIDGEYAITATATDVAGTSPASGALSVTVDTTDPLVAVVAPANGAVTNDDTPSVSGTGTLDSTVTVEIYAGSDTSGTLVETLTPTAAGGSWSDTATTLADGEYTVQATQTDLAGNAGTSTANTFTVDTIAPGVPSTPDLDAASDTGTSDTDNITSDTTPTFTGTAEAGSLVRILADGVEVGSGTATGGNYSITTSALIADEHDITATATDAADNTSGASGVLEVTIDGTVPAAPSTPDLDAGSDSGTSSADDVTSDTTPTFTGTAEPGSLVRIFADDAEVGSGPATGGNYSITTSALPDGFRAIAATATNVAGTSPPPTGVLIVAIDTTPPAVTVTNPADNSSTSDDTPLLEGAAENGLVTVTIYEGADTTGTANQTRTPTADGGLWSDTATTLAAGTYTIEVTQEDAAGNVGQSVANTFTVGLPGISGTVTNPDDSPAVGAMVGILTPSDAGVTFTSTDVDGNYFVALPDGDYKVSFTAGTGCSEFYDNETDVASAAIVTVAGGAVVVDAQFDCATISGQVTDEAAAGLGSVAVGAFDADENLLTFVTTNPGGNYTMDVRAGARKVAFQDLSATYASEWYDDAPSFEDALVLDLAPGDSVTADAVLTPGSGTITGNVTDESASVLPDVQVSVLSPYNELPIASTTTDANGDYTVAVSASEYKVRFSIAGCNEYYDDESDFASADVVAVAPDDDVTANEALDCATISGMVTDVGGALRGVPVQVFEAGSSLFFPIATATTDASGHYEALVGDGDYKVAFGFPGPGQCGEFYDDKVDLASATVITITGVDVVANAELTNCATISGTVTSAGGAPVAGLFMPLRDAAGNFAGATATDASGHYTHLVTPGDYTVEFGLSDPCGEFYDNKASLASADVVSIADGGRVTANAQLSCSIISGTVSGPTGDALSPVAVRIYTAADSLVASMTTDASGKYSRMVAAGDYKIQFDLGGGCGEWYNDKPDQASADVVSASGTDVTASASLPCDEPLEEGEISGTVAQCFGEDGCFPCGEGSCGILVQLHATSGTFLEETGVVDGQYSLEAPPGDYKIRFVQAGGCVVCAVTEWYDDKPDVASADVVEVVSGGTVTADAEIEFEGGI